MMNYEKILPITQRIEADRQSAKRHYGVHPYFTRRPYNVVGRYLSHYTQKGDKVLDPFGGSGVTAIEAFLNNRTGIHNDINPLANFIAVGIAGLSEGSLNELETGLSHVLDEIGPDLTRVAGMANDSFNEEFAHLALPDNTVLPKNSDVSHYRDLFSNRQLASLAIIKRSIDSLEVLHVKRALLLAWSASLAKLSKTFLSAEGRLESRGGSSIFSIYRYKVAKHPIELPPFETFKERALNIIAAKGEIERLIELRNRQGGFAGSFEVYSDDVSVLKDKLKNKIDYIFTDPPYGAHISYLDLSTLWNVWLGNSPDLEARQQEIIVGGDLALTEQHYIERLREAMISCMYMLRKDRWISVVFQHWNIKYFEAILEGIRDSGGELRAAVSQIGDPIWSMHKKKNRDSVLAGEMILTFFKGPSSRQRTRKEFDLEATVDGLLASAGDAPVFGEYIFNQLVLAAWDANATADLNIDKTEFSEMLKQKGWQYDPENHSWTKSELAPLTLF